MGYTNHLLEAGLYDILNTEISRFNKSTCTINEVSKLAGGSISQAFILRTEDTRWFLKLNSADRYEMFEAEADGLSALSSCPALRVPQVVTYGVSGQHAYLVLEYLNLSPLRERAAGMSAGRALAELHHIEGTRFGWHRANFIGSTPQPNDEQRTWPLFFARQRLLPQLDLAKRKGHKGKFIADGERLAEKLPALFTNYRPANSLLHGDLWHGNAAQDESGKLALFDPAVYYGDHEADLAMTELFGGFPDSFYAAYRDASPLADGFEQRKTLYNLYHILNHLNLFGSAYLHQSERMIGTLLAEIGR